MATKQPGLESSRLAVGARAAILCLGSAALTATLMLAQPAPNTPGELGIILFWTLPLAISIGFATAVAPLRLFHISGCLRYTLAPLIGAAVGLLWSVLLFSTFLAPYFGTFSIPVGLVWIVAGSGGLLPLAGDGFPAGKGSFLLALVIATLLSLGVGLGGDRLLIVAYEERTVDTVWIRWYPGPQPLELDPRLAGELTIEERGRLNEMDLTGHLDWQLSSTQERGPQSRMVILMQVPVAEPMDLALPAREPVIYIQQADGSWIIDPPDALLMDRSIRLAPDPGRPQDTAAFLKVPGGTVMFGGINWTIEPLP